MRTMEVVRRLFLFGLLVILLGSRFAKADTKLRIIHTNDMHARFDQTSQLSGKCSDSDASNGKCYGGFPRLLTAIEQQRKKASDEGIPLIFLNAGDSYQGTIWYSVYKWPIVAAFVNLLGLDAMSLGNHEFDDGPAGLGPYLRNVSVKVLACNVDGSADPDMTDAPLVPSTVIERGNLKIGVIGYLTPETSTLSQTGKVVITDEVECIKKEAAQLKASGVNIIVALGHSGYEIDQKIAASVPELDIVVGGHSHTFLYTGTPPDNDYPAGPYPTLIKQSSGRLVPVVQAYAFTKYLGVFDITFDDNGEVLDARGAPLVLNSSIEQNQAVLDKLSEWQGGIDNITHQVIGMSRVFLNGSCRFDECNLGNLITDAFVDYSIHNVASYNWTEAAIAVNSGGGVRASIESGTMTREDVITSFPFYNPILVISLQGQYLLEALEWSVARYDLNQIIGRGEFLQVSGIHVTYNLNQPVGSRVVEASALCSKCPVPQYRPIDPKASYEIVMTSFMAGGGDNYTMFSEHGTVLEEFGALDTDVLTDYILTREIVYNGLEERIKFVTDSSGCTNDAPTLHFKGVYMVTLTTSFIFILNSISGSN